MKKIKALREFSHYHLGTVDQDQLKEVSESEAEALVGMGLAELVDAPVAEPPAKPEPVLPAVKEVPPKSQKAK